MKANELMVGDWVKWKDRYVQVAGVSGVVYEFGHVDITLAHCNDEKLLETHDIKSIQPIPLTPEILEKNGFVKTDEGWYKLSLEKEDFIGLELFEGKKWFFGMMVFPCMIQSLAIVQVHELQHLLRLCKIEKEIVL